MNSLRSRLGAGLVASLVVMIALLWFRVGASVKVLLEQQMASRLAHDGEALLGGMQIEDDGRVRLQERRIPASISSPTRAIISRSRLAASRCARARCGT